MLDPWRLTIIIGFFLGLRTDGNFALFHSFASIGEYRLKNDRVLVDLQANEIHCHQAVRRLGRDGRTSTRTFEFSMLNS